MRTTAPKEFTTRVAARLHRLRVKAKLSQMKLAIELAIPPSSVGNHECGQKQHSLHMIARYARFYGVSIDELVKDLDLT